MASAAVALAFVAAVSPHVAHVGPNCTDDDYRDACDESEAPTDISSDPNYYRGTWHTVLSDSYGTLQRFGRGWEESNEIVRVRTEVTDPRRAASGTVYEINFICRYHYHSVHGPQTDFLIHDVTVRTRHYDGTETHYVEITDDSDPNKISKISWPDNFGGQWAGRTTRDRFSYGSVIKNERAAHFLRDLRKVRYRQMKYPAIMALDYSELDPWMLPYFVVSKTFSMSQRVGVQPRWLSKGVFDMTLAMPEIERLYDDCDYEGKE